MAGRDGVAGDIGELGQALEGRARGGAILPTVRLGVDLEPAFDPPVDDPVLGTPFALPTDGSSPRADNSFMRSGRRKLLAEHRTAWRWIHSRRIRARAAGGGSMDEQERRHHLQV